MCCQSVRGDRPAKQDQEKEKLQVQRKARGGNVACNGKMKTTLFYTAQHSWASVYQRLARLHTSFEHPLMQVHAVRIQGY